MLSHVGRTIILPDDNGPGNEAGSIKIGQRGSDLEVGTPALSYPDTLEVIRHPAPAGLDVLPTEIVRSADQELAELLQQFRDERSHRRSVRAAKVLVGLLATSLLAVWLLQPPKSGDAENHAAAAFPTLTPSGLVDGSSYRQTDAALRDRLALRQYVVKSIGEAARDKMGTSLNPEVVMGSTGVPFISEDFIFPCEHDFEPAKVDAGLRELRAIGRTTGKTITIAIAPDKSSILSGQLGKRGDALMACSDRVREGTEATWGSKSAPPVMMAWKQLAAEQAKHPGKVFQRGDSHWTSQGALIWSRALIAQLVRQGEAPARLRRAPIAVEAEAEPADNDLYRLMGISRPETVPVWRVSRPNVTIRAKSVPSKSGRGIAVFRAWSTTEPLITGRTLVVNDSFFSRAEGHLAPYFTNFTVLHWSDFLADVNAGTLPHFDRIIIETVQRGWPERSGWLEAGQPVHAALAAELGRASRTAPMPAPQPAASS
jgi:hypothetical protein